MKLQRSVVNTEILDPRYGFDVTRGAVEVRWDPLFAYTSRLFEPRGLIGKPEGLDDLARTSLVSCPFCPERIEEQTPRFPPRLLPAGQIRRGEAVLFPNLNSYAQFSSVSVYSPRLHDLRLGEMTERLVADNLGTQLEFVRLVQRARPEAKWASVNANHLPPSGSVLFHPHLQGLVDPYPTTVQRLLSEVSPARVRDYVETEHALGHRWLGSTGSVEWLCAFAPVGPAEIRAFVFGVGDLADVDDGLGEELGLGIAATLGLYAELGFESFNLVLTGSPSDDDQQALLILRIVARANPRPHVRSDATHLERLHWEAGVDVWPETVAAAGRGRFGTDEPRIAHLPSWGDVP